MVALFISNVDLSRDCSVLVFCISTAFVHGNRTRQVRVSFSNTQKENRRIYNDSLFCKFQTARVLAWKLMKFYTNQTLRCPGSTGHQKIIQLTTTRKRHLTTSFLIKHKNSINLVTWLIRSILSLTRQPIVFLSLDLSAASNTIDHHKLLSRLKSNFGISGWIITYSTGQVQCIVHMFIWTSYNMFICHQFIMCRSKLTEIQWISVSFE